jgi:hypothetical protein
MDDTFVVPIAPQTLPLMMMIVVVLVLVNTKSVLNLER